MKKICSLIIVLLLIFVLTGCDNKKDNNTKENNLNTSNNVSENQNENRDVNYEEAAIKQMETPQNGETIAIIKVKDYGDIKVKFFEDVAPKAVENFITHAENGYYDGVTFHRVIDEFMIQGGDPLGKGTGGPGYSIKGEFALNGFKNDLKHTRGVLSMARAFMPDSAGSQFFIMHENASHLDGQYAAFGKIIEGMDAEEVMDEYRDNDKRLCFHIAYDPIVFRADPVQCLRSFIRSKRCK